MNMLTSSRITLGLLGLAVAGALVAQAPEIDFPTQRTRPASCDDFRWHEDMKREHPRIINACQEVVDADGTVWARLEARFVRAQPDGLVVFSVRDNRGRVVERMMMEPAADQVAYIDGRAVEFRNLTGSDRLDLYVREGEYGYATRPAVASARFSRAIPVAETTDSGENLDPPANYVAANDARPAPPELPRTASFLPWLSLVGSTLLLGGATVSLSRKR